LVIRESNGKKVVKRINLNTADFLNSSYYYLKPNDIVYVEPNERKYLETNAQLISLFTGVMSAVSIILVLVNTVF
jgi:polysaccharide export outer membrane protein